MANLINNNYNFFKLNTYRGEFWDIFIHKNSQYYVNSDTCHFFDKNLVIYFDLTNNDCFIENGVKSINEYSWEKAFSSDYVLENIGYTGFDNGLLYFEKDKITNEMFVDLYSNSKYEIKSEDINLKFHFVTGCTKQFSYDYEILDDGIKLNGGFLQGFFRTECEKYNILPIKFKHEDVITLDFVLKPLSLDNDNNTINEKYPENKGFFWYIGTRSENKWIYLYDSKNGEISYDDYIYDGEIDVKTYKLTGSTDMSIEMPVEEDVFLMDYVEEQSNEKHNPIENCDLFGVDYLEFDDFCACSYDYVEPELDISDFIYTTQNKSFTIGVYEEYTDIYNPFILFNRTKDGFNVGNWTEGSNIRYVGIRNNFNENLFTLMNRTETGYSVSNIDKLKEEYDEKYNIYADLYENALGFRITNDGEIGYRYLTKNCEKENYLDVVEGYSKKNIVKNDEWNHVMVKIIFEHKNMFFKFYVNGNLVFISKSLPKLNLRELDEIYEKQETVPFNMSIGGGTQGLIETILPNYMINPYRVYPLEKYFCGSFVGYIKSFGMYLDNLNYNDMYNNFLCQINNKK